jgi:hypothetical protein
VGCRSSSSGNKAMVRSTIISASSGLKLDVGDGIRIPDRLLELLGKLPARDSSRVQEPANSVVGELSAK